MSTIIVRGRQVICRITGEDSAEVVDDGAVVVQEGKIIEVGPYRDLLGRYQPDEVIGSSRPCRDSGADKRTPSCRSDALSTRLPGYAPGNMDNRSLGAARG